jgi:hypothetical protein
VSPLYNLNSRSVGCTYQKNYVQGACEDVGCLLIGPRAVVMRLETQLSVSDEYWSIFEDLIGMTSVETRALVLLLLL